MHDLVHVPIKQSPHFVLKSHLRLTGKTLLSHFQTKKCILNETEVEFFARSSQGIYIIDATCLFCIASV